MLSCVTFIGHIDDYDELKFLEKVKWDIKNVIDIFNVVTLNSFFAFFVE